MKLYLILGAAFLFSAGFTVGVIYGESTGVAEGLERAGLRPRPILEVRVRPSKFHLEIPCALAVNGYHVIDELVH